VIRRRPGLWLLPFLCGQAPVPEWAQPTSANHVQVSPPAGFHRPPLTILGRIGQFEGQSDVGSAVVPGSASYDAATGRYRITSAGYNIWYVRDEFRYLWKRMSGDVSLAADMRFPDPTGYDDRKAVLVIRQSLDDDAPEAVVALHGGGMIHLATRSGPGERVTDTEYRIGARGLPGASSPDHLTPLPARRLGLEKKGDRFTLFVSVAGEPLHAFGPPVVLHLTSPFYVGIGFCSHLPATADTAELSDVLVENKAGRLGR
jgi:hypothetical protein